MPPLAFPLERRNEGESLSIATIARRLGHYWVGIAICAGYALVEHNVLSADNIFILLRQCSIFGLAALGAYFVAMADGILLSTGSQAAFTTVLLLYLSSAYCFSPWLAAFCAIFASAGLGVFYARVTSATGVPIALFSFGMSYVLDGLNAALQRSVFPSEVVKGFASLAYGRLYGVPTPIAAFCLCMILASLFLQNTTIGKCAPVVGQDEEEAKRSGLPVDFVRTVAYAIGFALISFAGIILVGRTSRGDYLIGNNYSLDVVAALCIGRVRLWGGRGSLFGVMIGALSIVLLDSYFDASSALPVNQTIIKGAIIVAMLLAEERLAQEH